MWEGRSLVMTTLGKTVFGPARSRRHQFVPLMCHPDRHERRDQLLTDNWQPTTDTDNPPSPRLQLDNWN